MDLRAAIAGYSAGGHDPSIAVDDAGAIPVNYGKMNEVVADVLVIGGGVAGLQAAINAARMGVKVAVLERGHAKRSGSGGAGVDHWHGAVTNPCSKVTPEMYTDACYDSMQGFTGAIPADDGGQTIRVVSERGAAMPGLEAA